MKKLIYIICFALLCLGCSGSSDDGGDSGETPENPEEGLETNSSLKVNLQFPHENGLCNLGTNITPTHSTVVFEWEASSIATGYTIFIKDLVSGNEIQDQSTEDKIGVVLKRATPYSWYVEATDGTKTETSDTWKFFNAGPGVQTYVPFPAVINSPAMAASLNTTNVTLNWTGSDVDNDIIGYDVYLGMSNEPAIHTPNVSVSELNVTLNAGSIYYWKVITKDSEGNTSESGIYQFKIE
ncbi:hypothetical protein N1F78_15570 [Seonamhaeicola sp. MEBiC1930]|uniref:hypothetical protein n=1 Tax=Seonamhaeicola sp. MEBiC01930 TaxID=2976768 RepID=UPI0032534A5B